MPSYNIQTYGCQMNYSDTERLESYLEALGYKKESDSEKADLLIFNTCSVKQKAEDKVFGRMKELKKVKFKRPDLLIAVTGCMVRTSSSRYSVKRDKLFNRTKEIDICLRIEELPKLAEIIREANPDIKINPIQEESLEDYFKIKASHNTFKSSQAFIPVSTGCDKFCTYCIVPFSRGREKSRNINEILEELDSLVKKGTKEITLLGQTVNSYGKSVADKRDKKFTDLPEGKEAFVYLLEKIDKFYEKGLKRVRFTSPYPTDISDQLIDAMANLRTQMPYLHLPVQAGDDNLLKRMNRRYSVEQYKEIVKKLRTKIPNIAISTDIIVGFCGETEEEYENTYKFFEEMKFEHAYISQYSNRKGTFASKNLEDDIPNEIKKKRWHKLNDLLIKISKTTLDNFIGKTVEVLVEAQNKEEYMGRNKQFKTVQFNSKKNLIGQIVPVKITNSKDWVLIGELV